MKKISAVLLLLSLALVLPSAATAKKHPKHHKTTVLKGSFKAVGADGAYSFKKFGKAQLVDNRKRDKLSVHLRKLAPKTVYTFALYSVPKGTPRCQEGASGGTQETAFPPKSKKTNKADLNAKQRSKTFKADRKKRYFVLVSDGDQVVACAKLDRKRHHGHGHGKKGKKGKKKHGEHGHKPATSPGAASAVTSTPSPKGKDKAKGKTKDKVKS